MDRPANKPYAVLASLILLLGLGAGLVVRPGNVAALERVKIAPAAGSEPILYEGSHALLIAAGNYSAGWARLTNVELEIREVARALESRGFQVRTVRHPTGRELRDAVDDFVAEYGYDPDNRLLIFFAGHGYTRRDGDVGYIVPVDAPDPAVDEKGFLRTAISMHEVLTWAKKIEAKHTLFVFDSCFSGSLFEARSTPKPGQQYIRRSTAKPVRQFITAGDAGEEVPARSVFTPQFIDALDGAADANKDGYVTGVELGLYLAQTVPNYNPKQSPQFGKIRDPRLDKGDFVFRANPPRTPAEGKDVEKTVQATPSRSREKQVAVGVFPAGKTFRDCPECPEMVVVPAGSFNMGSNDGGAEEKPVHRVTIPRPFAVGKFEVTFEEWDACVRGGGCKGYIPKDEWGRGRMPVIYVKWKDAQNYVLWLREKTGKPYGLLTEAEWEYAARAGTTQAYWWGDEFDPTKANSGSSGAFKVGSYPANAWGLHDMSGNVWEWVADCWSNNYQRAPDDGSAWGSSDCHNHVMRGGSWSYSPKFHRSAHRSYFAAYTKDIGFRVARGQP